MLNTTKQRNQVLKYYVIKYELISAAMSCVVRSKNPSAWLEYGSLIKISIRIRITILCTYILCHTHRVVVFVPGLIIDRQTTLVYRLITYY